MADIYTDATEEQLISYEVLPHGLKTSGGPKLRVLRMAMARSLQIPTPPDDEFDRISAKGSEYKLEQLTGKGTEKDFDDAVRALLSVYHGQDLFEDEKGYRKYLQRHIRRGLKEIRTSWSRNHDFVSYFQQELLAGIIAHPEPEHAVDENRLLAALREIGVAADLRERVEGARLSRCLLFLPDVNHYDRLRKGLDKLSMILGMGERGILLEATEEPKVVAIDLPRPADNWKPVTSANLWGWLESITQDDRLLPVWLGQDVLGRNFSFDLAEAPHLLVSGTTGSGKSVCLHSIIVSLLGSTPAHRMQLALVDPKNVEFARYEKLENLYSGEVVYLPDRALLLLEQLVQEMEKRHEHLQKAGVTSLAEGLKKQALDLPFVVLVVEELADLLMQSREIETPLVRLAQKARASGIHLVLATQRPDANILTGLLRSNIPSRIALRVQKSTESKIILDEIGAEALLGKGDMLVKVPPHGEPLRVHGAKITTDDLSFVLRKIQ
ncbi:MAG: FtsK/SpoIIIE domain-containing protein [Acidobacteriota bacterium]